MAVLLREALGGSLRRVRTDQGRTLREVSSNARVSLGYLSEIERGQKEASSELLAAICDALDVEIAEVLLDVGNSLKLRTTIAEDTRVVIPAPTDSSTLTAA
ncbi:MULTISPECIES: helix-turn-helix domain-containing protein [Williamsia]|uniref:Helix-turn-helix domain-containing protein n=2 Tax=Williamsia TaxID=85043 RepID=A0ABT1HKQ0_9NOCA|nr:MULTISPECIES: helix-turn-helix transcriptional regulator [Williamsia]MCP2178501.1 Helix-turn-helix domain-containing protein [Williamsia maris]GGF40463.1 transcriptional regulator ClgR [Williamsia phyllosphaerae]